MQRLMSLLTYLLMVSERNDLQSEPVTLYVYGPQTVVDYKSPLAKEFPSLMFIAASSSNAFAAGIGPSVVTWTSSSFLHLLRNLLVGSWYQAPVLDKVVCKKHFIQIKNHLTFTAITKHRSIRPCNSSSWNLCKSYSGIVSITCFFSPSLSLRTMKRAEKVNLVSSTFFSCHVTFLLTTISYNYYASVSLLSILLA